MEAHVDNKFMRKVYIVFVISIVILLHVSTGVSYFNLPECHLKTSFSFRITRSSTISPVEFFSSNFIPEGKRLNPQGKSQQEIEKQIISEYLKLPIKTGSENKVVNSGIIGEDYIPGKYEMGELKNKHPERYKQLLHDWVLGGLIEGELKGYALYYYKNVFPPTKNHIVSEIETKINSFSNNQSDLRKFNSLDSRKEKREFCEDMGMSKSEIDTFMNMSSLKQKEYIKSLGKNRIKNILKGKNENPISDKKYSLNPKILNNLSFTQLKSYYIRSEVENYLFDEKTGNINSEIKEMVKTQLSPSELRKVVIDIENRKEKLAEIIKNFLKWEPAILNGKKLEDEMTMLETEEIARKVIRTVILGNPSENFDFNYVNNKRANRWSYYLISKIEDNLEEKRESVERKLDDLKAKLETTRMGEGSVNSGEIKKRLVDMLGIESYEKMKKVVFYDKKLQDVVDRLEKGKVYSVTNKELENLVEALFQYTKLKELAELTTSSNIVDMSILSIREPFLANPNRFITNKLSVHDDFAVSSFMKFYKEIVRSSGKVELGYFVDNHGEVIFDLLFVKELLNTNPDLSVTVVPNSTYVANDVSYDSLLEILNYDSREEQYFHALISLDHKENSRFNIAEYGYPAQGIDIRRANEQLADLLKRLDSAVFKGAANFQSTQGINVDRYNLFMVKSSSLQEATGLDLEEQHLIFAYFPAGTKVGIGTPEMDEKVTTPFSGKSVYTVTNSLWDYVREHSEYYGLKNENNNLSEDG